MDPNAALERMTDLAQAIADNPSKDEQANELAAHVAALNEWIVNGGFLPEAWATPPRLQGPALARLVAQRGNPSRVHMNEADAWMMPGYWIVSFPDGFECGIAPNGDVSS